MEAKKSSQAAVFLRTLPACREIPNSLRKIIKTKNSISWQNLTEAAFRAGQNNAFLVFFAKKPMIETDEKTC